MLSEKKRKEKCIIIHPRRREEERQLIDVSSLGEIEIFLISFPPAFVWPTLSYTI